MRSEISDTSNKNLPKSIIKNKYTEIEVSTTAGDNFLNQLLVTFLFFFLA